MTERVFCSQVSYGEMVGCDNTDVSMSFIKGLGGRWFVCSSSANVGFLCAVSDRVVPLRLRGPDGGSEGEVVLSSVHGGHEEERQPPQIDCSPSVCGSASFRTAGCGFHRDGSNVLCQRKTIFGSKPQEEKPALKIESVCILKFTPTFLKAKKMFQRPKTSSIVFFNDQLMTSPHPLRLFLK